jgi:NhaP-type Na+/H+ or K+/H+ antiporter
LSLAAAIALGAILAPTDPVRAGGFGAEPSWERGEREKSRARFTLTAEAAANDWLASPIALVAVFVATEGGTGWLDEWALFYVLYAILAAAAIGALVGYGIARLAFGMRDHKMLAGELSGFIVIGAVLLTFGFAEALDSYGFLAVLAAGMSFRRYEMDHEYNERIHRGAVVARNFTELIVILLLGSLVTTELLSAPGLAGWLLVGVLLFVIRPVSTLIATIGSPLDRRERTLVAWFGVRGVAAVYYVALLIEEHAIVGSDASAVLWTTVAVVLVSILVHGASAAPLERRLLQ